MGKVRKVYAVGGMHCAGCASRVEDALRGCVGVESAGVNLTTARAWVVFEENAGREEKLREAVEEAGFRLEVAPRFEGQDGACEQVKAARLRFLIALGGALGVMALGWIGGMRVEGLGWRWWVQLLQGALAGAVVLYAGREFHIGAARLMRHGGMSMDTLVSLSTLVSLGYSLTVLVLSGIWGRCWGRSLYFDSAAMIVAFILLGRWLESRAKRQANGALVDLMGLQPQRVMRVEEGGVVEVPLEDVVVGDRLLVRVGMRVPVDGVVLEGAASVDESSITGESIPARRGEGERVYAGTMVQQGSVTIQAQGIGKESVFGRIVESVEAAQGSKAPVQRLADRVASRFVPLVLAAALLALMGWFAFGGEEGVPRGIVAAIAVLAVACPCAMGLATPTAMAVAIGRAAKEHILIRDAAGLQKMSEVTDVAFDKTGTLTEGRARVEEALWLVDEDGMRQRGMALLRGLEQGSRHPLAGAVLEWCGEGDAAKVEGLEDVPGYGVKGSYKGEACGVGSVALLKEAGVSLGEEEQRAATWSAAGSAVVCLYMGSAVVLLLRLTDSARESAIQTVRTLNGMGIATHLLTGDSLGAARRVALELGIKEAHAGLLPQDKQTTVAALQAEGKVVAMVGDGINDTQALVQADVGIAMGSGADVAMGVADITLVTGDIGVLLKAMQLSKQTMRVARQNLFWAFFYNALAIPLAAGVLYPLVGWQFDPMVGALAMAMSSVSVVTNSLRLRK